MILFLDPSALVKLYVEEADSETVRGWVEVAEEVACQWIAYVEARSALAAKRRLGDLSDAELVGCKKELEEGLGEVSPCRGHPDPTATSRCSERTTRRTRL